LKHGGDTVGARTRLKVVKNKLAPPFRQAEIDILYGRGVCKAGEALQAAEAAGLLAKSGAWLSFADEKLGNGKENARERLLAEPALLARLVEAVRAAPVAFAVAEPSGEVH
jgi:recombination protein RecA